MTYRRVLVALAFSALLSCSSGGGGGGPLLFTPSAPWAKFRNNAANTGTAIGSVANAPDKQLTTHWKYPNDEAIHLPISASPAIGLDHTVYAATEGGELVALKSDGSVKWTLTECRSDADRFGTILSSPAVTSVRPGLPATSTNDRVIFFGTVCSPAMDTTDCPGSTDYLHGRLYAVQDQDTQGSCLWSFTPPPPDDSAIVSSPTFLIDPVEEKISAVFVGTTGGFFYALNGDGSLKWQYPRTGTGLGAITASPAMDSSGPIYFTTADGNLYALTLDGALRFRAPVGAVSGTFAASPARGGGIYVGTEDGVVAINSDGSLKWRFISLDGLSIKPVIASVALGVTGLPPPTATAITSTVTPATPLPTPTPTPVLFFRAIVFAVADDGQGYAIDDVTGKPADGIAPLVPAAANTTSSPALSLDGCLVFGDDAGNLNVRQLQSALSPPPDATPTATPSSFCTDVALPIAPGSAIRSSPSIDSDGSIYVGTDDGHLYAIKASTIPPSPTPSATASPTP